MSSSICSGLYNVDDIISNEPKKTIETIFLVVEKENEEENKEGKDLFFLRLSLFLTYL